MLHRRDLEQGVARFYSLMIERDLFGTIRLVRSWGRRHSVHPVYGGLRFGHPSVADGSDNGSARLWGLHPVVHGRRPMGHSAAAGQRSRATTSQLYAPAGNAIPTPLMGNSSSRMTLMSHKWGVF